MNCEQCRQVISAFLDNELDETSSVQVQTHLADCRDCALMCEDVAIILDFCLEENAEDILPPHADALWRRINNVIETDIEINKPNEDTAEEKQGLFAQIWNNNWQFSFSQILVSFLGIAIISSLITIVGLKSVSGPKDDFASGETTVTETIFDKVLAKLGLIETPQEARQRRLEEQQKTIDYWTKRVEKRRSQWSQPLRETFDRNLKEIDQVVSEYHKNLEKNPHDALSGEMLDSAMNEKMDLLREFSDL